jgi:hypothetical protein
MTTPVNDDLRLTLGTLRQAAQDRNYATLQGALESLLGSLDYFYGLQVALQQAEPVLPAFESAHPEATWARGLLVWLASYGVAPADLPHAAGLPHSSPGAANFISALIDLARSAERKTPLENRLRFLATAFTHLILADLAVYWYGENPDAWVLQQAHGDDLDEETGLPIRQALYQLFWLDEVVAARDTALWLKLAATLEDRLTRG